MKPAAKMRSGSPYLSSWESEVWGHGCEGGAASEEENSELKKLLAHQMLNSQDTREIALEKNSKPGAAASNGYEGSERGYPVPDHQSADDWVWVK